MTLHLSGEQRWSCPNCTTEAVTHGEPNRFHNCPGLKGLTAPLVLDGTRCKVEAVEREDYVGDEDVRLDGEGRPVISVVTTRDEGQDCVAFAATAHAKGDE
ncbi:hypothetical protein [Streptomyces venezuelae]|uniref:hypothetical protein n=1 Tax=Streptomyces venezuelae TaxID=54571 RepID=UPI00123C273B|nr:hypothetical protein [Streptomyces venezuelae]